MELSFEDLDLNVQGEVVSVPDWFIGLTKFSYEVCSSRKVESTSTEHFVLSLPQVDGGLTAIALGALAAETERIESSSNFREIQVDELKIGMRVSVSSGSTGQQQVTGEIKSMALEEVNPKIAIGSRWIATRLIQKIFLVPDTAGNPHIFKRKPSSLGASTNFIQHLSSASLPIHRALLDLRSTTKILEDEMNWEFISTDKSKSWKVSESINPITSGHLGTGWSLVMNTTESEELASQSFGAFLNASELNADISILCSGSAILAQLENTNSRIVFSVFGRDDRQLAATELAIKQKYEYSNPLDRKINFNYLVPGMELICFEVPINA